MGKRTDIYSYLDVPVGDRQNLRRNKQKIFSSTMVSCYYVKIPPYGVGKNIVAPDYKTIKKAFPQVVESGSVESVCLVKDIDHNLTPFDFNSYLLDASEKE
jgi:hypothetical protein